jgi:hypothetical protein
MSLCRLSQLVRVLPRRTSASISVQRPVADRGDGFARGGEGLDELHGRRVQSQLVRIRYSARQEECVEFGHGCVTDRRVRLESVTRLDVALHRMHLEWTTRPAGLT